MLRLLHQGTMWSVDFSRSKDASKVFGLFGGYILPTPYTTAMPVVDVIRALAALNPGEEIVAMQWEEK